MQRVTVGIPTSGGRFLRDAVESVLAQTHEAFDLIVSDDSRLGVARDLLSGITDPRLQIIQGPQAGFADNLRHIWEHAENDLLHLLRDEDVLFPTALEELTTALERDPRYNFALSRRHVLDDLGRTVERPVGFLGENWVWFDAGAIGKHLVSKLENNFGELSATLIRRSAFDDSSCLTTYGGITITRLVDVAFMLNASERGRSVAVCRPLVGVRRSPGSEAAELPTGLFEWELFLRGAVKSGLLKPQAVQPAVTVLESLYRRHESQFEEVALFSGDLGDLRYRLSCGETRLLDDRFKEKLRLAQVAGERRLDATSAATGGAGNAEFATASTALVAQRVKCEINQLSGAELHGWAWLPDAPEVSVRVEALSGERVVGHALANELRDDLLSWNVGTGRYGFRLKFYAPLEEDALLSLRFYAEEEGWLQIQAPPQLLQLSSEAEAASEAELLIAEQQRFTSAGPEFEDFNPTILQNCPAPVAGERPLVVAFYLPQFHATPENNEFWGRGFTEWRQLARALPRFRGHYQPRIPRDLGFYDLSDVEVMRRQVEMALAGGVGAFAFYYYWFNRQRVLHRPIELFLDSDIAMPFFIIWANENWTRNWDGLDQEVLLRQDYTPEHEDDLLADIARHMLDPRYVRLQGRPLFVIYNPAAIPDPQETITRWRRLWKERFDLEPLIFMAQTFGRRDPNDFGLDGALEFPPHKLSDAEQAQEMKVRTFGRDFTSRVYAYDTFVEASLREASPEFPLIKTAVPSWDNNARKPGRGLALTEISPAKYQQWLTELLERAMDRPIFGRPLVAVNAWNEWAEGAYLEPDVYYGSSYLNATARALKRAIGNRNAALTMQARVRDAKITVICPCYNHGAFLEERLKSIIEQTQRPDEILFLDDASTDDSVAIARKILSDCGIDHQIIVNRTNSGSVFAQWVKGLELARHEFIWIAETDDSAERDFLERLLPHAVKDNVMGAFSRIQAIDEAGEARPDLDGYYDGLSDFAWLRDSEVPAYRAFTGDFAIKNVIPNVSGLLFRRPRLSKAQVNRLLSYSFAGDWFFYACVFRGGAIAYVPGATSYFRIRGSSASRDALLSERHIREHAMVLQDLEDLYGLTSAAVTRHAEALAPLFPNMTVASIVDGVRPRSAASRPLRICVAAHSFAVGGGELAPIEIANVLSRRGHHVTYLVLEDVDLQGDKNIRWRLDPDIAVFRWDHWRESFEAFVNGYGIDVLNSHNIAMELHLSFADVNQIPAYVASLHGGYESSPQFLTPQFLKYIRRVERWFFLTEKNLAPLRAAGIDSKRFLRGYNALAPVGREAVDRAAVRAKYGVPQGAFTLVLASRAVPEKGWDTAIEVARRLNAVGQKVHLLLVGEGAAADALRKACADDHFVTFAGHVDHPAALLPACDLAIFPSRFAGESLPMFLLEAFSAGVPAIATDLGEIARLFGQEEKQKPGAVFAGSLPSDELAAAMARMVLKAIEDPKLLERWRRNARAVVQRFDINRLVDLYETTFRQILGGAQAAAAVTGGMPTPAANGAARRSPQPAGLRR